MYKCTLHAYVDSVSEVRGRPLMIWGGDRRKSRKKISEALLQGKINFERHSSGENNFYTEGVPGKNFLGPQIINGRPLGMKVATKSK